MIRMKVNGTKSRLTMSVGMVILGCSLTACQPRVGAVASGEERSTQNTSVNETETQVTEVYVEESTQLTCLWEDVTIFLPENWEGAYLTIEDEESIDFYQKASYEEDEGSGYVFSISKGEEWMDYYAAGETMLAYTDSGVMYYLMQPTDVPVSSEDENVINEYVTMVSQVPEIQQSIQIKADGIHYDADQYQIPISSVIAVEKRDLVNFTDNQLWIARNEIYARHGRTFRNEYLQSYFNSCSWYNPIEGKTEVTDDELSEVERGNLEVIVAMEEIWEEQYAYPKAYALDTEVEEHLLGDNKTNTISYKVTPQGDEFDYVLTIDGVEYDLKDYLYMTSPVTDEFYIVNLNVVQGLTNVDEDGLEIAVLDEGPSHDPMTHFFKYDGDLHYLGEVTGFPFADWNSGFNGFTNQSGVYGTVRSDLIETAYLRGYWWYDSTNLKMVYTEYGWHEYQTYKTHELLVDLPLNTFCEPSSDTVLLSAQQEVYFLQSDLETWIYVRGKDGTEGYIFVEDGMVKNVGLPAEEVFTDLMFFD